MGQALSRYAELLRDPRWQERRLRIMEAAKFSCVNCGTTEKTLAVHHKIYIRGRKPWEYEDHLLECICEDCHTRTHNKRTELDCVLAMTTDAELDQAIGYIKALYSLLFNQHDEFTMESWEQAAGFLDAYGSVKMKPSDFLDMLSKRGYKVSGEFMRTLAQ